MGDSVTPNRGKSKTKRRPLQWSYECKLDRVQSVRRRQIESIIRLRYGELALPDNHDGRAILCVLLELGCDGVRAQEIAPWCAGELVNMIAAADRNFGAWSTKDTGKTITELVGERIECTLDEFQQLRLTHIWPADADRHVVQECLRQRKLERNRKHNAKRRPKKPRNLSTRAAAIFHDLRYGYENSVRELVQRHLSAFDGLDHQAARRAMLRAIRELIRHDLVETRNQIGHRGLKTLYVKRPMTNEEIRDVILAEDFPDVTESEIESERGRPARAAAAEISFQEADEE